jgi:hypothetical protein
VAEPARTVPSLPPPPVSDPKSETNNNNNNRMFTTSILRCMKNIQIFAKNISPIFKLSQVIVPIQVFVNI